MGITIVGAIAKNVVCWNAQPLIKPGQRTFVLPVRFLISYAPMLAKTLS